MFDSHRERLLKKRLKYHNAVGNNKPYKALRTPCLCSCYLCSKHKELYGNCPQRYTFSDQKKIAKAIYDLKNENYR